MLLAIDTATQSISLAVHDGANVLIETTWHTANNPTIQLAPTVQELLDRVGLGIDALTAVAVSIGPGTYTGLRIGVALAKALASARHLPLVGISTLDILAAAHSQTTGSLMAIVQAGRGRIVAGVYGWRKGKWRARSAPHIYEWSDLLISIDGPTLLTGEIDEEGRRAIQDALVSGAPITLAPAVQRLRRAGYLAEEAWSRLRETDTREWPEVFPPATLVPVYAKTKDTP